MNIIIYSLVIFVAVYLILRYIANTSAKKISKGLRIFIFIFSVILAILFLIAGRFILSLPLLLLSLGIIKLKGLTLYQIIGLFRLIQFLRNSRRFSFKSNNQKHNTSKITLEEAYKILNLDIKKKISKEEVKKSHLKIQKKIHPDISPETSRLSTIVNEARDIILKHLN
tara:strand:- start:113 stop:619 length:507 start_codon:yes stop_codon:yes gene_type:complete